MYVDVHLFYLYFALEAEFKMIHLVLHVSVDQIVDGQAVSSRNLL